MESTDPTQMPSSGSVRFTGDYGAAYSRSSAGGVTWGHMTGDAQVDIALDTGVVTGVVTNRQNTGGLLAGNPHFNTSFGGGQHFANGEFTSAQLSGGTFLTDSLSGSLASTAIGFVVGPDGNEMLVAIDFGYRAQGNTVTHLEHGAIIATRN